MGIVQKPVTTFENTNWCMKNKTFLELSPFSKLLMIDYHRFVGVATPLIWALPPPLRPLSNNLAFTDKTDLQRHVEAKHVGWTSPWKCRWLIIKYLKAWQPYWFEPRHAPPLTLLLESKESTKNKAQLKRPLYNINKYWRLILKSYAKCDPVQKKIFFVFLKNYT